MTFSIIGKKALITGAGGGIGQAIAVRLASEGASCVLAGRNVGKLDATRQQIASSSRLGGAAVGAPSQPRTDSECMQLDVAREEDWKDISKRHPDIDILVNCAGTTAGGGGPLVSLSIEQIDEILDTNLRGAVLGCKYMSKRMLARKSGGCVINVSSLLARMGSSGVSAYAASKAGLIGLTTSLAVELGRANIRVNAVLPGYVETAMIKNFSPEKKEQLLQRIPLRRYGTIEEVADAVAFLAKNPYASNCIVNLDGGLSAT